MAMAIAQATNIKAYPARARRRTLGRRIRAAWRGLRWAFALGLVKAAFYVAKAGCRPYEPVEIGGRRFNNVGDSDGRWRAVAEVLDRHAVHNVLDVGCAEGWFVRRAAKDHNCFAVGIEATDACSWANLRGSMTVSSARPRSAPS
jgi:hypothetical protein